MKVQQQTERYLRAQKKVEEIKSFYGNLLAYCLVIPILAWINYQTTSFVWVVFPALGWGIGLAFHALRVYGYDFFLGKNWEERKIQELMAEDKE